MPTRHAVAALLILLAVALPAAVAQPLPSPLPAPSVPALEAAAAQGNPGAQSVLGVLLLEGRGVAKDERRGVQLIQRAARAGLAGAQVVLGALHAHGRGVPRSDEEAVRWYRRAAEQGHPGAQGRLGLMLAHGRGVPQHNEEAVDWWRRGAQHGDTDSQGLLGIAYYDGAGVEKDTRQAYFWLLLAAAGGGESSFRYKRFVDRIEAQLTPQEQSDTREAARAFQPQRFVDATPPPTDDAATPAASPNPRPASTGSGILVARDRVVTNHHVIQGCQRLRVGGAADGRLMDSDPKADLALIEWQPPASIEPATVRLAAARIGEPATVAGYPLNGLLGFNVTTGNVSSLSGLRGDARLLQISAPVQPGNSGGALLDAGGHVLGVVVGKLNALRVAQVTGDVPQNVNFAIRTGVLAAFLEARGVDFKRSAQPATPLTAQQVAGMAQSFTVLVECWR